MAETSQAAGSSGGNADAKGGLAQRIVMAIVIIVAIVVLLWGLSYLMSNPSYNIDTLLTGSRATPLP